MKGWIGVDLDGTLAEYDGDVNTIGKPIEQMCDRVRAWLKEGKDVRIVTARVAHLTFTFDRIGNQYQGGPTMVSRCLSSLEAQHFNFSLEQKALIERWCEYHLGKRLPVVATKDYAMVELWDDRAVSVFNGRAVRFGLNGEPEEIK